MPCQDAFNSYGHVRKVPDIPGSGDLTCLLIIRPLRWMLLDDRVLLVLLLLELQVGRVFRYPLGVRIAPIPTRLVPQDLEEVLPVLAFQ